MYIRQVFETYTPEAIAQVVCTQSAFTSGEVKPRISFHNGDPSHVKVIFHPGDHVEFVIASTFESPDRRDFFTNRWIACCAMFAEAKLRQTDLAGYCDFWVDDFAKGPGLAFSSNSPSHVLVPDSVFFETGAYHHLRSRDVEAEKPWKARESKVFWRGASTGIRALLRLSSWRDIPRFKLCIVARAQKRPDLYDISVSNVVQIWDPTELAEIATSDLIAAEAPQDTFMDYRYSIDIDGNTNSWPGLFTKLLMKNTVIKADSFNGYRQWYYDRLIPWKTFVPLSEAMDDLPQVVEYLLANPEEAETIAGRGLELAQTMTYENEMNLAVQAVLSTVRT